VQLVLDVGHPDDLYTVVTLDDHSATFVGIRLARMGVHGREAALVERKCHRALPLPMDSGLARVHEACQQFVHRTERYAMIFVSNRGFAECEEIFADSILAAALLDQLSHRAMITLRAFVVLKDNVSGCPTERQSRQNSPN